MLGKDDTDNLGCFVQYRIAFYVAGGQGLTRRTTLSKLLRCCLLSGGGGGMVFRITGELLFVLRWVSSVQEQTIRTSDPIRSQCAPSHGRRSLWIERDSDLQAH